MSAVQVHDTKQLQMSASQAAAVHPLVYEFLTSGTAVSVATCFTNPVDVVKVRIQLEATGGRSLGMLGTAGDLIRNEGVLSLWKGLTPSVARGFFYGGIRLGLYTPIKNSIEVNEERLKVYKNMFAGATSGALAAGLSNPTDLIKTQLQAKGCLHSGPLQAARAIIGSDGVLGLWKGTVPSMARAAVLTASQCATYDGVKRSLMAHVRDRDDLLTHVLSSMVTGLVTTTATSPVDVMKTRMFMGGRGGDGVVATAAAIAREEGAAGFFRGWTANYARLGPQTLITFVVAEQLRRVMGLQAM